MSVICRQKQICHAKGNLNGRSSDLPVDRTHLRAFTVIVVAACKEEG